MRSLIATLPDLRDERTEAWSGPVTPAGLAALLPAGQPLLWLESGSAGPRHLLLGCLWSIEGRGRQWLLRDAAGRVSVHDRGGASCFQLLDALEDGWLRRQPAATRLGLYLAYESGWQLEKRRKPDTELPTPDFWFFCPRAVLDIRDGAGRLALLAGGREGLFAAAPAPLPERYAAGCTLGFAQDRATYLAQVGRIKAEIRAGNSFQVNLSQEVVGRGPLHAASWAASLFGREPGPFSSHLVHPDFSLVSQSPERLVRREPDGRLITRPIAGTLPRGRMPEEEEARVAGFRRHFKELAEHNMLIDLERNDLGKVSLPGSVRVGEHLTVESYAHLHHLVSEVVGQARPGTGAGAVAAALFPGGTITGCPKLETMHILDAVELGARGPYTGSLGHLGADGTLDLNILIRTALVRPGEVRLRVGGGIVWDSEPEREYLETLTKARGLVLGLLRGGAELAPAHRDLAEFFR